MRFLILFSSILMFYSCGGNSVEVQHDQDNENNQDESLIKIDGSNPDSLIASYISARQQMMDEAGVEINGSVFLVMDDYFVVNFEENRDEYTEDYCVIINSSQRIENTGLDGVAGDAAQVFAQRFDGNYTFLSGRFEEAPDYDFPGDKWFVLANTGGYRTSVDNGYVVYHFADNDPRATDVNFIVRGEGGICEGFDGITESLQVLNNREWVAVMHEENVYNNCELVANFKYRKIWDLSKNPSLRGTPTYVETICETPAAFSAIPKTFYLLSIVKGDTLMVENDIITFKENTLAGETINWSVSHRTTFDAVDGMMVYFEKINENKFFFVERGLFMGAASASDPYIGETVVEHEEQGSYVVYNVDKVNEGLYKFKVGEEGRELLYTSNPDRFNLLPDESDADF